MRMFFFLLFASSSLRAQFFKQGIHGIFQPLELPRSFPGGAVLESGGLIEKHRQARHAFGGNQITDKIGHIELHRKVPKGSALAFSQYLCQ
jgi:hypothetical protein